MRGLDRFIQKRLRRRKFWNAFMCSVLAAAAVVALTPLFSVFSYVVMKGFPALSWSFFTEIPKPVGEAGGGMANSLAGTLVLVFLGSLVGVPWGIAVGVYLSDFGRGRFADFVRFATDMLASTPSIVIGLFVYALIVIPMRQFSAIAGGVALGMIMIPTVARSTEELLKMVPAHIREAGLALGLPRWKVTLRIVLKGTMGSIITGVVLSIARAAGETAPLLFTAFGNRYWSSRLDQPIASLPVQIYTYAIGPFEEWHNQAWAGAFVLVMVVVALNLLMRAVMRPAPGGRD